MPLQKLTFKPGVNREATTLANEGGWWACDRVRFRSGYPEQIGGWQVDAGAQVSGLLPDGGQFWGVARALWVWLTLNGNNLLGIGTHLKYYIQNGMDGTLFDVTPLRDTTTATTTFAATNGSSTVTVTDNAHGAGVGDFVTFSGAVSLGGVVTAAVLNAEFRILTVPTVNTYTIDVGVLANGSDTGNGGGAVDSEYQLSIGLPFSAPAFGWGAGGWGGVTGSSTTGWGESEYLAPMRFWSQANYGENLIFNVTNGPLFLWVPGGSFPGTVNRGELLWDGGTGVYQTDVNCPAYCTQVLVSDASRFVIALGVNDLDATYGGSSQDPMLVRWSDQEDYTTWTPEPTNQAGGYRLSHGSYIVGALQTRQEVLVWTDAALYSMQYLGPPYVWGFNILADNVSVMSANSTATANGIVFWMGLDKFYVYTGRVETLSCTLRQYVFGDINLEQRAQIFCSTNEAYNEVWWFYCSANSATVDRYVVFNYLERLWYYGTMERTMWLDTSLRTYPIATNYDAEAESGNVIYHEYGVDEVLDDSGVGVALNSYIESADTDVDDGHRFGFIWRMLPDVTFEGSISAAPEVTLTLTPRRAPGSPYGTAVGNDVVSSNDYLPPPQKNYSVQLFTEQIFPRLRGRQIKFKIAATEAGTKWQLGEPRVDLRPDGRRQ
jgi:hypothetical protein